MARHDALTGLPNRMLFREQMEDALPRVKRDEIVASTLDLDRFKSVNDTLGHPIGDALLAAVDRPSAPLVRDTDMVARLGGDEFAIVQVGARAAGRRDRAARARASRRSASPTSIDGHQVVIGTSVGVAIAPTDGRRPTS